MMDDYLILIGDERFLEIWDLAERVCVKKLYLNTLAPVMSLAILMVDDLRCLAVSFGDLNPEIWVYRTDNWKVHGCTNSHTRGVTKIIQAK